MHLFLRITASLQPLSALVLWEQHFNFLTELINSVLEFLDQCSPISEIAIIRISPVWPCSSSIKINYLECILYINAAKLYWLPRNLGILRCQSIKRVKFFCLDFLKSTSAVSTGESHAIYAPPYTTKRALRSHSRNVFREGESDC